MHSKEQQQKKNDCPFLQGLFSSFRCTYIGDKAKLLFGGLGSYSSSNFSVLPMVFFHCLAETSLSY